MKKKRRTRRATYWGMAANSTARDFGFGPVSGKGGKTTNCDLEMKKAEAERLCKQKY